MNPQEKSQHCRWCNPDFTLPVYCSEDCKTLYLKVLYWSRRENSKLKLLTRREREIWLYDPTTNSIGETPFNLPFRDVIRMREAGASWAEIGEVINTRHHKKWKFDSIFDMSEMA